EEKSLDNAIVGCSLHIFGSKSRGDRCSYDSWFASKN
ncbi:hypothetical protein L195_g046340, partial [Trifolium pratense]